MIKRLRLSVIIPAYNEAGNIREAVVGVEKQLKKIVKDFEIIVINDGSTDNTAVVVNDILRTHKKVRFINRSINKGLGFTFLEGVKNARMEYVTAYHGDNDASPLYMEDMVASVERADMIGTYPQKNQNRSYLRRIISGTFIRFVNLIFGLKIRYYNGAFMCKKRLFGKVRLISSGFTIYAEAKIKLMRQGYSLYEVPYFPVIRVWGRSKAVNIKSLYQTVKILIHLVFITD
ncbi:hypothetical protein A2154_01725 [Candidatus Gottesmanbacteria bacterium RBG_16_43_7]|uniref:Glycosyltransferase 2-like domain-containing protein n=1 Tax=Candidatus Gottesmanbacteria bacterium RBG_16_43_7 TaxID=1798373 RepID=A0A1F5Z8C3_9BACT|nr:MAG: hypothetical protein A2154_01725 [Candidatus Gottesmanbacteria bacterium RBG_16_43_7]